VDDIIPEDYVEKFRLLSARGTLDRISVDEIVALADDMLNASIFKTDLLAMIDCRPRTISDIYPIFEHFFVENKIPIGDKNWAIKYMLVHFIGRMADADSDPDFELCQLLGMMDSETQVELNKHDSFFGVSQLMRLGMQYNYYIQFHDVDAIELENARLICVRLASEMRTEARRWINNDTNSVPNA